MPCTFWCSTKLTPCCADEKWLVAQTLLLHVIVTLPSERLIFLHQDQHPREQPLSWSCVLGIVDSSSEKWFNGTLQSLNNLSYANTLKTIASRLHATFSVRPGHKVFHASHRIEVEIASIIFFVWL